MTNLTIAGKRVYLQHEGINTVGISGRFTKPIESIQEAYLNNKGWIVANTKVQEDRPFVQALHFRPPIAVMVDGVPETNTCFIEASGFEKNKIDKILDELTEIMGMETLDPHESFAEMLSLGFPVRKTMYNLAKQTATIQGSPAEDIWGAMEYTDILSTHINPTSSRIRNSQLASEKYGLRPRAQPRIITPNDPGFRTPI